MVPTGRTETRNNIDLEVYVEPSIVISLYHISDRNQWNLRTRFFNAFDTHRYENSDFNDQVENTASTIATSSSREGVHKYRSL